MSNSVIRKPSRSSGSPLRNQLPVSTEALNFISKRLIFDGEIICKYQEGECG